MVITEIDVVLNGPAVHVTVDDQGGAGHPINPSLITWSGVPSAVTIVQDGTGFLFTGNKVGSYAITATELGNPNATRIYQVVVTSPTTGLGAESP